MLKRPTAPSWAGPAHITSARFRSRPAKADVLFNNVPVPMLLILVIAVLCRLVQSKAHPPNAPDMLLDIAAWYSERPLLDRSCRQDDCYTERLPRCRFEDSRGWCCAAFNEVSIDYNAAFTGALARLVAFYDGMKPFSDCTLDLGWSHPNATLV